STRRRRASTTTGCPAPAPSASTTQELDVLCHDLGDVPLHTLLVLVGLRSEPSLDVDLTSFGEVLAAVLGHGPEHGDPMPLRLLFLLVRSLVVPLPCGRDVQRSDGRAPTGVVELWVSPEIAHEDDFVDGHRICCLCWVQRAAITT